MLRKDADNEYHSRSWQDLLAWGCQLAHTSNTERTGPVEVALHERSKWFSDPVMRHSLLRQRPIQLHTHFPDVQVEDLYPMVTNLVFWQASSSTSSSCNLCLSTRFCSTPPNYCNWQLPSCPLYKHAASAVLVCGLAAAVSVSNLNDQVLLPYKVDGSTTANLRFNAKKVASARRHSDDKSKEPIQEVIEVCIPQGTWAV